MPRGAIKTPHIAMTTALKSANPEYNVLDVMTHFKRVEVQVRNTQKAVLVHSPNCEEWYMH